MREIIKRYLRAIIICHGKSEMIFCDSIKSNLRLSVSIEGNNNGNSSIQITSLIKFLKNKKFRNSKAIIKNFPNIKSEKGIIKDCKIFIIMDLDEPELSENMISDYKTGKMFKEFDYSDSIVPIYNNKNLDDVCIALGYNIDVNNKKKSYDKVFPGANGDIKAFRSVLSKFSTCKNSNMNVMLEYLNDCIIEYSKK